MTIEQTIKASFIDREAYELMGVLLVARKALISGDDDYRAEFARVPG